MRDYEIISTDSHLEVPPYMWEPYVEPEFRQFCPKVVKLPSGGDAWVIHGRDTPVPLGLNFSAGRGWENLKTTGLSYDEGLVGAGDGLQRLGEMDEDGVDAEILFPAVAGQRTLDTGSLPPEAYVAITRGYNDWLSQEYTAADRDRLLGLAILPATCLDDQIEELRRVATLPGIRGVVLHSWPSGGLAPIPELDDRFWELAIELDMPLTAHVSFGGGGAAEAEAASKAGMLNFAPMTGMLSKTVTRGGPVIQLIQHGTLDRFPQLQFFFAETQVGWIPEFKEDADENWRRHRFWSGADWPHPPSWYVDRHFHWGFQVDRFGLKVRHDIGIERIQWSTDFPHVQCDWPNSRKLIDDQFAEIPRDEARKILRDNAYAYFQLDRERWVQVSAASTGQRA